MQLDTYQSLEDKERVFTGRHKVVNTKDGLERFFAEIKKEMDAIAKQQEARINRLAASASSQEAKDEFISLFNADSIYVFRGLREAKFKLYTSAQRYLFSHDLFSMYDLRSFMRKEIDALKSNSTLMNYWNRFGINATDLLCMCYLQHYEAATPLLDFTKDMNVGLFFMQDNMEYPSIGSNNAIDNYCSLYYLATPRDLDIMDMFINGGKNAGKMVVEFQKQIDSTIDSNEVAKDLEQLNIDSLYDMEAMLWLDNTSNIYDIKGLNINISTVITNLNLEAQKGCFVINLSGKKPYEGKRLHCCDIHKSLVPYIRDFIQLTHDDIYPLDKRIAKAALDSVLKF